MKHSVWFILDENNELVPVDWITHCRWLYQDYEGAADALNPQARIGDTHYDDIRVSTVFLGSQTNDGIHAGRPMPFETLVTGGRYDGRVQRYATYAEAARGHEDVCRRVFGGDRN